MQEFVQSPEYNISQTPIPMLRGRFSYVMKARELATDQHSEYRILYRILVVLVEFSSHSTTCKSDVAALAVFVLSI